MDLIEKIETAAIIAILGISAWMIPKEIFCNYLAYHEKAVKRELSKTSISLVQDADKHSIKHPYFDKSLEIKKETETYELE